MPRGQLDLFSAKQRKELGWNGVYGGDSRPGMRKVRRPLDVRKHLHLVLRARDARGERSMLHRRNRSRVERVIYRNAVTRGVLVARFENVGNHLHLLVRTPSREAFQAFLRGIAGVIARVVTAAQRGRALGRKYWATLAFSRVVSWGRELNALRVYLDKNRLEALGFGGACLKIMPSGRPVVVIGDPKLWAAAMGS